MAIKEHGLTSYNILKNMNYKPLIISLNAAAAKYKQFALSQKQLGEANNGEVTNAQAAASNEQPKQEHATIITPTPANELFTKAPGNNQS